MAKRELPSPEALRQLLRYDPETGKLFWKERGNEWFEDGYRSAAGNCAVWNSKYSAKEALTAVASHGYKSGSIFDRKFLAHRVIWVIAMGYWPVGEIDHINGNPLDNRLENLREASRQQNSWNTRGHHDSLSGVKGVTPHLDRWRAGIWVNNKNTFLGVFETLNEARSAYEDAASMLRGKFAKCEPSPRKSKASPI